jgi:hypothetical protein
MERRSITRLPGLAALLVCLLTALHAATVPTADGQVFQHPEAGYTITFPTGWDLQEHDGDHDILGWATVAHLHDSRAVALSVTRQNTAAGTTLQSAADGYLSTRARQVENYVLSSSADGKLCGYAAKGVVFNGNPKDEHTRQYTALIFMKDETAFIIEYHTEHAHAKADAPVLRAVAMSFCFDTTKPVAITPAAPARVAIPDQSVTVLPPAGWRVGACAWSDPRLLGLLQRKLAHPTDDLAAVAVGLMTLPAAGLAKPRVTELVRERLRGEFATLTDLEQGDGAIGKYTLPWVRGATTFGGRPVTCQTYYVVDGKRALLLMCLSSRGAETANAKEFGAIVNALELQADPTALPPPTTRRSWAAEGFSLVPPTGWAVAYEQWPKMPSKVVSLTRPRAGGGDRVYETVYCYHEALEVVTTPELYLERNNKTLAQTLPGYKALGNGDITINGLKGKWQMYTCTTDDVTLAMVRYLLLDGKHAYVITSTATPESYAKYKKAFEECVLSFKVEK